MAKPQKDELDPYSSEAQDIIRRTKKAQQRKHPKRKRGVTGGNLASHLAYKSFANAEAAASADKSAVSREGSARIAKAPAYTSRSV